MLNSKILLSSSMLAMVAACSSPAANTASSVSSASSSITGFSGADMGKFAQLASANPKPFTAAALSLTSMAPVDFYDTVTSFVEDAPFQLGNSTVTNLHATMLTNRPNFLQAASKFTTAGDMLGMNDIDFSHQPSTDDLTKSLTAVGASVPHATALALTDDGSDSNQDPDNDLEGAAPGSPTYASTTCKTGAVINAAVDSVATPSKVAVGAYCLGAFGVHAGADAISATAGNLARGRTRRRSRPHREFASRRCDLGRAGRGVRVELGPRRRPLFRWYGCGRGSRCGGRGLQSVLQASWRQITAPHSSR